MQPAPPLPPFIARQLPFRRFVHTLESGPDAGRRIHFIDEGEPGARPVLMLHGNPTWSFLWRKVISLLPGFRCVAPDLLGLGLSDRLPRLSDHAPERHAGALAGLVEALDLRELILVGQDWGGSFGTLLASRVPDRVAGAVFANTVVSMPDHPRRTLFHKLSHLPGVSELLFRGLGFPVNVLWMAQGDRRSIPRDVARAYRWPLATWADRAAPLALARLVPSRQDATWETLRQGEVWLRSFQGPVSLVWGMRDPILGRALRRHERALPQAPVTRTQAGHFLQEEVPEALAAAVEDVARRAGG